MDLGLRVSDMYVKLESFETPPVYEYRTLRKCRACGKVDKQYRMILPPLGRIKREDSFFCSEGCYERDPLYRYLPLYRENEEVKESLPKKTGRAIWKDEKDPPAEKIDRRRFNKFTCKVSKEDQNKPPRRPEPPRFFYG